MTGRSAKRAIAAGVVLAALTPVLALAGCSASEDELESQLSQLPGVSGAFVWTTTSGLPTNRGYGVRLYVGQEPVDDLTALVDDALRTTWTYSAFEPTNGVRLEVSEGERPDDASPGRGGERVQIEDAVSALPWAGDQLGVALAGASVKVPREALAARYGEWSDAR